MSNSVGIGGLKKHKDPQYRLILESCYVPQSKIFEVVVVF